MSYIGNQPADIGVYAVQSETGNGVLTAFTLDRAATTATILVSIDGVDQIPTTAYAVSGTTLTFTSAPPNTSVISIRFLGDTVSFGEPSDDSVATAKIQDDAVTAAKLANSINTEIAANTAKVTNATHTGDVTGATALTIATDAVDIAMLSATGTADATTFLRGDNAWAAAGGGKVLQVVTATISAERTTTSSSFADVSGMSVNITPEATTSKVLVMVSGPGGVDGSGIGYYTVIRGSTNIGHSTGGMSIARGNSGSVYPNVAIIYLDSPATTSSTTYKMQMRSTSGTTNCWFGSGYGTGSITVMEIGA